MQVHVRVLCTEAKDVLVATDVASKGLDLPGIEHVINYDMPTDIENYVHRIGRTGRQQRTGVATTFINRACDEHVLLDLRQRLLEAHQAAPAFLAALGTAGMGLLATEDWDDLATEAGGAGAGAGAGCGYCGGLGHRIGDCPKL